MQHCDLILQGFLLASQGLLVDDLDCKLLASLLLLYPEHLREGPPIYIVVWCVWGDREKGVRVGGGCEVRVRGKKESAGSLCNQHAQWS